MNFVSQQPKHKPKIAKESGFNNATDITEKNMKTQQTYKINYICITAVSRYGEAQDLLEIGKAINLKFCLYCKG